MPFATVVLELLELVALDAELDIELDTELELDAELVLVELETELDTEVDELELLFALTLLLLLETDDELAFVVLELDAVADAIEVVSDDVFGPPPPLQPAATVVIAISVSNCRCFIC